MTNIKFRAALLVAAFLLVALGIGAYSYAWPKLSLLEPAHAANHFRHMDKAFPVRVINAAAEPVALETAPVELDVTFEFQGETRSLEEFLERSQTTGFLVVHNDRVVYERYFKGYSKDDLATSFSVAKSWISTLVGIAVDEGLIESLDDPITKYVAELQDSGFDGVPISDILQMSSGIDFTEVYDDRGSDAFTINNQLYLYMRPMTKVIGDYASARPPGEAFHYASINTQSLSMLLTAVYGRSVSELMEEKLWRPLGAEADAKWLLDMHGNEIGFWGLNATLRDFAKLGLLYLHEGAFNGRQIVSSDWVRQATTPDKPFLQPGQIDGDWGYQYQWWAPRGGDDYSAIGIYGQFIYVNPAANVVIVKTSADMDFKPHEFEAVQAFRAIAATLQQ